MITNLEEAVERTAERTVSNTQDISQKNKQRRNQVTDVYGAEHVAFGDNENPATIYLSVSPALIYHEKLQFKLIIQPFRSTVKAGTTEAEVTVNNTSLSVSGNNISPNPHKHTTESHSHNVVEGVAQFHTDADDFRVKVEGIDITAYLMAQYGGAWINGEGIYPSQEIEEDYDILEVASDLRAEGKVTEAEKLVSSGFKPVEISSSKPFQVTLVEYKRHSHTNR